MEPVRQELQIGEVKLPGKVEMIPIPAVLRKTPGGGSASVFRPYTSACRYQEGIDLTKHDLRLIDLPRSNCALIGHSEDPNNKNPALFLITTENGVTMYVLSADPDGYSIVKEGQYGDLYSQTDWYKAWSNTFAAKATVSQGSYKTLEDVVCHALAKVADARAFIEIDGQWYLGLSSTGAPPGPFQARSDVVTIWAIGSTWVPISRDEDGNEWVYRPQTKRPDMMISTPPRVRWNPKLLTNESGAHGWNQERNKIDGLYIGCDRNTLDMVLTDYRHMFQASKQQSLTRDEIERIQDVIWMKFTAECEELLPSLQIGKILDINIDKNRGAGIYSNNRITGEITKMDGPFVVLTPCLGPKYPIYLTIGSIVMADKAKFVKILDKVEADGVALNDVYSLSAKNMGSKNYVVLYFNEDSVLLQEQYGRDPYDPYRFLALPRQLLRDEYVTKVTDCDLTGFRPEPMTTRGLEEFIENFSPWFNGSRAYTRNLREYSEPAAMSVMTRDDEGVWHNVLMQIHRRRTPRKFDFSTADEAWCIKPDTVNAPGGTPVALGGIINAVNNEMSALRKVMRLIDWSSNPASNKFVEAVITFNGTDRRIWEFLRNEAPSTGDVIVAASLYDIEPRYSEKKVVSFLKEQIDVLTHAHDIRKVR